MHGARFLIIRTVRRKCWVRLRCHCSSTIVLQLPLVLRHMAWCLLSLAPYCVMSPLPSSCVWHCKYFHVSVAIFDKNTQPPTHILLFRSILVSVCVCVYVCFFSCCVTQKLTRALIKQGIAGGTSAPSLQQVTDKFEELYQGRNGIGGLKDLETLIPAKGLLHSLGRGEEIRACVTSLWCGTHYAILVAVIS